MRVTEDGYAFATVNPGFKVRLLEPIDLFLKYRREKGIILTTRQAEAAEAFLKMPLFKDGVSSGKSFLLEKLKEWDEQG